MISTLISNTRTAPCVHFKASKSEKLMIMYYKQIFRNRLHIQCIYIYITSKTENCYPLYCGVA